MARLKGKLPLLLIGAVLLSMTWLGYWIGQMQNRSHLSHLQEELLRLESKDTKQKEGHVDVQESPDKGFRRSGIRPKGDNVYVVSSHGILREESNYEDEIKSRNHALGIHQTHANKISQHLMNVKSKKVEKNEVPPFQGSNIRQSNFGVPGVKSMEIWNATFKPQRSKKIIGGGMVRPIVHRVPSYDQRKSDGGGQHGEGRYQPSDGMPPARVGKLPDHGISLNSKMPSREAIQAEIEFEVLRKRLREEVPVVTTKSPIPDDEFLPQFDPTGQFYALIHNRDATKVHGQIHQKLRAVDSSVPKEAYTFKGKSLPKSQRLRPSVANGHLGTAIHSPQVFMNGVYNGRAGESHRAVIPSTVSFNITGTEPPTNYTRTYILNAGEGVYSEESLSESYTLTQRIFAHRKYSRLLVVEVDLLRKEARTPLKLQVHLNKWTASPDITFLQHPTPKGMEEVSYKAGTINAPETADSERTEVHIFYDHVPDTLTPVAGALRTKWVFLTSIARKKEEALEAYKLGSRLAKSNDELYAEHIRSWASVWAAGRIDVVGNIVLAQYIYGAFYYIISSMPLSEDATSPFIGLSPSGLPFGEFKKDYGGHVFWDQETWMYPAILPFWPSLGRILLNTRRRTMKAAAENARLQKHQGLQYPWESAFTGTEVTPNSTFGEKEIHISGDISQAVLQYIRATNDTSILNPDQQFAEILTGIANFWVSVLKWNSSMNLYELKGVIPPDEHHQNVNNSVYTNAVAKISLLAPELIFKKVNKTVDRWKQIAEEIYIPYKLKEKYHPEYDGYKKGTKVKQADAILLGFPLMINMDVTSRKNDLKMYQEVTDVSGPAMSWPMFTIGWLELDDPLRSESMFKRSFSYIKNEYMVWQETVLGGGATNFITGMGGFLQALIYGYAGFRFRDDRLDMNPSLPLDCTELHLTGVNYLGSTLNIFIHTDSVLVNLVDQSRGAPPLVLFVYQTEEVRSLQLNHAVRVPRMKATITPNSSGGQSV